jgi:hypothetical protein
MCDVNSARADQMDPADGTDMFSPQGVRGNGAANASLTTSISFSFLRHNELEREGSGFRENDE